MMIMKALNSTEDKGSIQFWSMQCKQKSLPEVYKKVFLKTGLATSFTLCPSFFLLLPTCNQHDAWSEAIFQPWKWEPHEGIAKASSPLWKLDPRYLVAWGKYISYMFKPLFPAFSVACRQTHLHLIKVIHQGKQITLWHYNLFFLRL